MTRAEADEPSQTSEDRPTPIRKSPRADDRESTWQDGVKSGLKVGLITGSLWGAYGAFFGATLASAATSKVSLLGAVGLAVFVNIFVVEVIYCLAIGVIAGSLSILCYKYDAMKVGSTVGVIYSLMNFSFAGVFWAAAYGSLAGWWISHAEKRSRGQYSEI